MRDFDENKFQVLFRRSESTAPKIMDFHMDPEYRKYVLSEEYENGVPLSYKDYLKKRETEDQNKKSKLLGSHGRKQGKYEIRILKIILLKVCCHFSATGGNTEIREDLKFRSFDTTSNCHLLGL